VYNNNHHIIIIIFFPFFASLLLTVNIHHHRRQCMSHVIAKTTKMTHTLVSCCVCVCQFIIIINNNNYYNFIRHHLIEPCSHLYFLARGVFVIITPTFLGLCQRVAGKAVPKLLLDWCCIRLTVFYFVNIYFLIFFSFPFPDFTTYNSDTACVSFLGCMFLSCSSLPSK